MTKSLNSNPIQFFKTKITHSSSLRQIRCDLQENSKSLEFATLQEWIVISERNLNEMHSIENPLGYLQVLIHTAQLFEASTHYWKSGRVEYAQLLIIQTEVFQLIKFKHHEHELVPVIKALTFELCGDIWSLFDPEKSRHYYSIAEEWFSITNDENTEWGKWSNLAVMSAVGSVQSSWAVLLDERGNRFLPQLWGERKHVKLGLLDEISSKISSSL